MRKKIFITGSSGLVGSFVYAQLSKHHECYGVDITPSSTCDGLIDLSNKENIRKELDHFRPDMIINSAAIKDMLACEDQRRAAWAVNVELVGYVTEYMTGKTVQLIQLSSDMIFDGVKGDYRETDAAAPLNWYGATKLAAEQVLRLSPVMEQTTILRTAQVFGPSSLHSRALLKASLASGKLTNQSILPIYVYERLKRGKPVTLPQEITSSPTPVTLIADVIEQLLAAKTRYQVFHVTGSKAFSRLELGRQVALAMDLPLELIVGGEDATSALRPLNASMNTEKLVTVLGIDPEQYDVITYLKEQILEDQISATIT